MLYRIQDPRDLRPSSSAPREVRQTTPGAGLETLRAALLGLAVTILLGVSPLPVAALICDTLIPIAHDQLHENPTLGPSEQLVRFEVPDSGLLFLELVEPIDTATPLRLDSLEGACGGLERKARTLGPSARRITLVAPEAGPYDLRIAARDPSRSVGPYRLVPRFLALEASRQDLALDLGATVDPLGVDGWLTGTSTVLRWPSDSEHRPKTELEEVEPNPGGDPSLAGTSTATRSSWVAQVVTLDTGGPWEPTVGWKTELEEVEPNPGGLEASGRAPIEVLFFFPDTTESRTPPTGAPRIRAQLERPAPWAPKTELEEVEPNPGGLWAPGSDRRSQLQRFVLPGSTPLTPTAEDRRWRRVVGALLGPASVSPGGRLPWPLTSRPVGCDRESLEDADQLLGCAVPLALGASQAEELSARWATDLDTFVFFLDELTTIELVAPELESATVALYDRYGQRLTLAPTHRQPTTQGLRHVETLVAGRYYVRIEGPGASEQEYRLRLRRLDH